MKKKTLKNKMISVLLLVVILAADFNFLPLQSIINQTSQSAGIMVAYAATTKPGKWIKESNGKWWYKHTDGTYTKNDWEYINGYWYHFDSSGYMQTGWLKVDGKWYHLNSEGKMHIGWVKIGNYWYHFDSNGVRQTGWQKLNGNWYYFNSDGIRQVGWIKVGNYWYHLDSEGIMQTGWQKLNGNWYYFNSDGIRQVGWIKVGDYWYHLDSEGIMQTGWQKLNGNWYYFNSDGVRQVGWQQVDGKWYHLNSEGIMETGWQKLNGDWYYFDSNGVRQTGWKKIDGSWYYFNPETGKMNTKKFREGSREYGFFDNGALKTTELNVSCQATQGIDWCWAACARSVGIYDRDIKITQKEIYDNMIAQNGGVTLSKLPEAIVFASKNTKKSALTKNFGFQSMVNEIDKNRPSVMILKYKNNAIHTCVCAGYDLERKALILVNLDFGVSITKSEYINSSQSFFYFGDAVTCPYIAYTY